MKNARKQRNIMLVITDKRKNQLVPKPNYCKTKWFSEALLAIEMYKIKVEMSKLVYLRI